MVVYWCAPIRAIACRNQNPVVGFIFAIQAAVKIISNIIDSWRFNAGTILTTETLLNTAEHLFAEYGYDGVGMRALADDAGVNLGAATYHYGSKKKLYIETVMRRLRPIAEERLRLLRQAEDEAKGEPVPVEKIVECMLRPPFMTVVENPHFPVLLARNLFMPPPFMQEVMAQEGVLHHDPFIGALALTLPNLPLDVLQMREAFARGVLLMFSSKLSMMQLHKEPEFCEPALKEMVSFISAGFRAGSVFSGNDLSLMTFSVPSLGT